MYWQFKIKLLQKVKNANKELVVKTRRNKININAVGFSNLKIVHVLLINYVYTKSKYKSRYSPWIHFYLDYIHTRTEYGAFSFRNTISTLYLTIYMTAHPLLFVLFIMQTEPKAGKRMRLHASNLRILREWQM